MTIDIFNIHLSYGNTILSSIKYITTIIIRYRTLSCFSDKSDYDIK